MARLPYLDKSDVKPEFQDLLSRPINLYRVLVHSPEALRAFNDHVVADARVEAVMLPISDGLTLIRKR